MGERRAWRMLVALALVALPAPALAVLRPAGALADEPALASYVDPFVGTLGAGFVFPGAVAPFGMVQLSPDTLGPIAYAGYMWNDAAIRGFSHVHVESMGVPSAGDLPFMPFVGPVLSTAPAAYASPFSHATESASPGRYEVLLARDGVAVQLAAGLRVGMHRYAFPPVADAGVLLHAGLSVPGDHDAEVEVLDARNVAGTAWTTQGYQVHFHATFDRPFAGFGAWSKSGAAPTEGLAHARGVGAGASVRFDAREDRDVVVKVGISFVSRENAKLNLDAELPIEDFDLDALAARTRVAWNDALAAVLVEGATIADRRAFYTALYHAMHHPNVFTDANGEYRGHDGRVHVAEGYVHYANWSLWDTYRGEMQLLALVAPERYRDMMRSLVAIARESGRVPRWSLMHALPDYMVGEPALVVFADAWCRGLLDRADAEDAWPALRRAALESRRDSEYLALGFVPDEADSRSVSATLEHALADFALALLADGLDRADDRDRLLAQSGSWRNQLDPDTRFFRPRHADGSWVEPFLPEAPFGFAEGTAWQYQWLAPHDVAGLLDAIGPSLARERLDRVMSAPAAALAPFALPEAQNRLSVYGIVYAGDQYAPGNEHDLQAPYLYAWTGEPWKTQGLVRGLQGLYRAVPDGLPGNDDLGSLSAWFVWSALGLYPPVPGAGVHVVASPLFERATVRLPDGELAIEAPGASLAAKFVARATLDGGALDRAWVLTEELRAGATLRFEMGAIPNVAWGAHSPPPSASTSALADFGCRGDTSSRERAGTVAV